MADQILIGNIRGKDGNRGQTGNTPLISVNIDNLPAGSTPTVGVSGSIDNPLITFGIPAQDAGTVVVFTMDENYTEASTTTDFSDIHDLLTQKENVRFFLESQKGNYWELNYFYNTITADETNEYIDLNIKDGKYSITFRWDANGVTNFSYKNNTIAEFTYTTLATW